MVQASWVQQSAAWYSARQAHARATIPPMDRQSLSKTEREERASEQLADKLDALSRPLAERVLGRAIELQAVAEEEALEEASKITYDDLRAIALEVGIPEEALRKALLEELDTEKDHGATPTERVTGPRHVRGGVVVDIDDDEIQRRLRRYFEQRAGLEFAGRGEEWMWWRRGGPFGDRVIESITTTQSDGDHRLVELDVDTTPDRGKALRTALIIAFLITIFGGPAGFAVLVLFGIAALTASAVFLGTFRRFVRRARRGINQALEFLMNDDEGRAENWLDVIEEALEQFYDNDDDD